MQRITFRSLRFFLSFCLFFSLGLGVLAQENQLAILPQATLKDAVHEMIDSAQKEILLAHFILLNDKSGVGVVNRLIGKAKDGVKIRLILDGLGAYSDEGISKKNLREMASHGIEIKVFHPKVKHFYKIWKRMHDKILLVDDKALLGSSSFWHVSFDRWQVETDIIVKGDILTEIKMHFEEIWNSKEVSKIRPKKYSKEVYADQKIPFQKVLQDLKFNNTTNLAYWFDGAKKVKGKGSYEKTLELIRQAQNEIIIVNPYFLPDSGLRKAMAEAKKRDVQVSIFTNSAEVLALEYKMLGVAYSKCDRHFKKWRVTVYEAPEIFGMIHSKLILVDNKKIYIGGQNLDHLGSKHNTENGVCFESPEMTNWFRSEILFYKASFQLAFQDGVALREPYSIKNKWKWHWRKLLACMFRNVL